MGKTPNAPQPFDTVEFLRQRARPSAAHGHIYKAAADEIERLREALGFYADHKNYRQQYNTRGHRAAEAVLVDDGYRARTALGERNGN